MSVKENANWAELTAALTEASNDERLINMGFWLTDWEDAFKRSGVSGAAFRLARLLQSNQFEVFNDKLLYLGNGGSRVNLAHFASWLAARAAKVGATVALQDVQRFLDKKKYPVVDVLVLSGIDIQQVYEVGSGFKFMPLSGLSSFDVSHLSGYLYSQQQAWGSAHPSAALVAVDLLDPTQDPWEEGEYDKIATERLADQDLFWHVLCLQCSGGAPTPLGRWSLLPEWAPFSGRLDGGYTSALEIKHSKTAQSLEHKDVEKAIALFKKLKLLPEKVRAPIVIALYRLSQSMNTWDKVQRAIDLGVALESVLVGDTKDQLSFQFRLMGALLSGDSLQERKRAWDVFKAVYSLRSNAVHNGTIQGSKFQIYGEQNKLSSQEIMLEGSRLARIAIAKIIDMGGLSPDEYTNFILSAGGHLAE